MGLKGSDTPQDTETPHRATDAGFLVSGTEKTQTSPATTDSHAMHSDAIKTGPDHAAARAMLRATGLTAQDIG